MERTEFTVLEFVGGPLDGHLQPVSLATDELLDLAIIPVNCNLVRMLTAPRGAGDQPPTSIAVYQRADCSQAACYRYLGSAAPGDFHWET